MKSIKLLIIGCIGFLLSESLEAIRATPGSVIPLSFAELQVTQRGRFIKVKTTILDATKNDQEVLDLVRTTLEKSPELVRAKDKNGSTLLSFAADSGRLTIVELLLDAGSDPLALNDKGESPRARALAAGHPSVAAALRDASFIPSKKPDPQDQKAHPDAPLLLSSLGVTNEARFIEIRTVILDEKKNDIKAFEVVAQHLIKAPELARVKDDKGLTLHDYASFALRRNIVELLEKTKKGNAPVQKKEAGSQDLEDWVDLGKAPASQQGAVSSQDLSLGWGYSGRQGFRSTMEDTHVYKSLQILPSTKASYFGIFDGHAGVAAAKFAEEHSPDYFLDQFKKIYTVPATLDQSVKEALEQSYLKLDKEIQALYAMDGATAISALALGQTLYLAWAGDSRAVLINQEGAVTQKTVDHKPDRPDEKARIESKGSMIFHYGVWRVGGLAISRTLGDRDTRASVNPGAIISLPETLKAPFQRGDTCIIACDGLWDVMSNEEAAKFVHDHLQMTIEKLAEKFGSPKSPDYEVIIEEARDENKKYLLIARGLRDLALSKGSRDNISIMIVHAS